MRIRIIILIIRTIYLDTEYGRVYIRLTMNSKQTATEWVNSLTDEQMRVIYQHIAPVSDEELAISDDDLYAELTEELSR